MGDKKKVKDWIHLQTVFLIFSLIQKRQENFVFLSFFLQEIRMAFNGDTRRCFIFFESKMLVTSQFFKMFKFLKKFWKIGECSCDDDGCGIGVCHPADDDGQTAVRSSGQDDRIARDLVLRTAVHRQQELLHLAQAQQKGSCANFTFPFAFILDKLTI